MRRLAGARFWRVCLRQILAKSGAGLARESGVALARRGEPERRSGWPFRAGAVTPGVGTPAARASKWGAVPTVCSMEYLSTGAPARCLVVPEKETYKCVRSLLWL